MKHLLLVCQSVSIRVSDTLRHRSMERFQVGAPLHNRPVTNKLDLEDSEDFFIFFEGAEATIGGSHVRGNRTPVLFHNSQKGMTPESIAQTSTNHRGRTEAVQVKYHEPNSCAGRGPHLPVGLAERRPVASASNVIRLEPAGRHELPQQL